MMKPTNSQQVESKQTKEVSQQVESDVTPRTLDTSLSFQYSPEVTKDRDHIADEDTKAVKNQGQQMGQV